jgi:hypothetical protein
MACSRPCSLQQQTLKPRQQQEKNELFHLVFEAAELFLHHLSAGQASASLDQ